MAKSIFREYDIRGIFEKELNDSNVKKIGYFFALEVLNKNTKELNELYNLLIKPIEEYLPKKENS